MARSIATLKARGTYEPNEHVNEEKFPPLTVAEHLEMLALGERIARYYRHPSQVDKAVRAGASWEQIAAATGATATRRGRRTGRGPRGSTGCAATSPAAPSAWTTTSTPPRSRPLSRDAGRCAMTGQRCGWPGCPVDRQARPPHVRQGLEQAAGAAAGPDREH